jgi:type III secretory pathway component EscT
MPLAAPVIKAILFSSCMWVLLVRVAAPYRRTVNAAPTSGAPGADAAPLAADSAMEKIAVDKFQRGIARHRRC